jgi:hypothetical protein
MRAGWRSVSMFLTLASPCKSAGRWYCCRDVVAHEGGLDVHEEVFDFGKPLQE